MTDSDSIPPMLTMLMTDSDCFAEYDSVSTWQLLGSIKSRTTSKLAKIFKILWLHMLVHALHKDKFVQIVMPASTCAVRQACQPTMIRHEQKQSTSIYGNNFSCY